jgi:hypothetical protein
LNILFNLFVGREEHKNSKIALNLLKKLLLFENKGIDSIIEYVNKHQKIKIIIVWGKEV